MLWSPLLQSTCKRREERHADASTDRCRQGQYICTPAQSESCQWGEEQNPLLLLLPGMSWPKTHFERGQDGI